MATSQASRTVQIKTPLGTDALLLTHFSAHEQVSRLFEYDLQMLSDAGDLSADKILGQPVTVMIPAARQHEQPLLQWLRHRVLADRL